MHQFIVPACACIPVPLIPYAARYRLCCCMQHDACNMLYTTIVIPPHAFVSSAAILPFPGDFLLMNILIRILCMDILHFQYGYFIFLLLQLLLLQNIIKILKKKTNINFKIYQLSIYIYIQLYCYSSI